MSQATNTDPAYDVVADARRGGVRLVTAAAVIAVMVQSHGTCSGRAWNPGYSAGFLSLFGWAHWVLAGILLAAGLVLTRATSPTVAAVAAAIGFVPALQLAGGGVVALRHWVPAGGISGCAWNNLQVIELLAILGAAAGVFAAWTCLRVLMACRALPASSGISTAGRVSFVIGALVAVALPLLLAVGAPDAHDITSLGAFALLWSLPWGAALVLTAWLPRAAAVATGLTVAVSAESAYPNYELVRVEHHWVAVLVGVTSGLLVAALRSASADRTRASQGGRTPR